MEQTINNNIITTKFSLFNSNQRYIGEYKKKSLESITTDINELKNENVWKEFFESAKNKDTFGDYFHNDYKLVDNMFAKILKETINVHYNMYKNSDEWDIEGDIEGNKNISDYFGDDLLFKNDFTFAQKVLINNNNAKVALIGDIHSSLHSPYDIVNDLRKDNFFNEGLLTLKSDKYIFFLGDIVDRGVYGVELLAFIFNLKNLNPTNVFIINGNHEDYKTYKKYGLGEESEKQLNNETRNLMDKCMYYLPSVIYLKFNNKLYHLSHGAFDLKYSGFLYDEWLSKKKKLIRYIRGKDEDYSDELKKNLEQYLKNYLNINMEDNKSTLIETFRNNLKKQKKSNIDSYRQKIRDIQSYSTMEFNLENSRLKNFLSSSKLYSVVDDGEKQNKNQFKWGDFYQSVDYFGGVNSSGRGAFGRKLTNDYIENHGIDAIMSGHQDMINLGLIINKNPPHDPIKLNNNELVMCNKQILCKAKKDYDLYVPNINSLYLRLDDINKMENIIFEPKYEIKLKPNKDFIALVTSTSHFAKNLHYNCYLILQANEQQGGTNNKYHDKYYEDYMNIKKKYLNYKNNILNI